jgi:hypothetical protein
MKIAFDFNCTWIMASSGESDYKKENQPVRHTQWLKSYPHAIAG